MDKLIINPAFQRQLSGLKEPTILADASGTPLGEFVPKQLFENPQPDTYQLAERQCPYSPEQLKQMKTVTGRSSLAEFWRAIGAT